MCLYGLEIARKLGVELTVRHAHLAPGARVRSCAVEDGDGLLDAAARELLHGDEQVHVVVADGLDPGVQLHVAG